MTDYGLLPDDKLVAACKANDSNAWTALVGRYERLVYTVPTRYGLTPTEVEDVYQTVWLSLLKNLSRLRQPERVAAWLVTTARRECWERRRGADYNRSVAATPDNLPPELDDSDQSPEETVEKYRRQQLLHDAVARLGERCRQLLQLLYYDAEVPTYNEVADRMEMPVGSIGPVRSRCLKKLRDMLAGVLDAQ